MHTVYDSKTQHPNLDDILQLAAQAWPDLAEAARAELQTIDTTQAALWAMIERGAAIGSRPASFERDAELARFFHELTILYRNHSAR